MAVNPEGRNPWLALDSINELGGNKNKANLQGVGNIDPTTDVSAEQLSSLIDYALMAARTAPFAIISFTADDTGAADPNVDMYKAMHGVGTANAPTATRIEDGVTELTWDATYEDSYGNSADTKITAAHVSFEELNGSAATADLATYELINATTIRVYLWNSIGSAFTDGKVTLSVWTNGE